MTMKARRYSIGAGNENGAKKGSAAVMLTCVFVSVVMASGIIGEAASRKASVAISECALETAGRSVMAGYDRELRDRYGLFAYEYGDQELCEMIKKFAEESLSGFSLTECHITDINVEKNGFQLSNPEIFKQQITDFMKYRIITDSLADVGDIIAQVSDAGDLLKEQERKMAEMESEKEKLRVRQMEENKSKDTGNQIQEPDSETGPGSSDITGNPDTDRSSSEAADYEKADDVHKMLKELSDSIEAEDNIPEDTKDRVLKNGKIWKSLPSAAAGCRENSAFTGVSSFFSRFAEFKDFSDLKSEICINEYILRHFTEYTDDPGSERFFSNEIEYILYGSYSDNENHRSTVRALRIMRNALNTAYLCSDSRMMQKTLVMAESLTPGPFAPLTQLLLITAWSAVESENDIKNLEAGNRIPFIKSPASWAVNLESVISGNIRGGMIENDTDGGWKYDDYLKLLLMTQKTETKLLRMMDLIQINMKGTSRIDFVLSDLFCGFTMEAEINKKTICPGISTGNTSVRMTHTY